MRRDATKRKRIVIMGAGGRDFHNFNMLFRDDPATEVLAFTAAQIPFQHGRRYPASLAGPLYPKGIPILDEEELPSLVRARRVQEVVFAYSDVSHREVMFRASEVLALGADFRLLGPESTMLAATLPVVSVCAVRTGCGKSPLTRYLAGLLMEAGWRPVVVRHPMAYGRLDIRAVEALRSPADLDRFECTLEEREEYEPLVAMLAPLYAGVDYQQVLREAEMAGDVLLWDGGNNDFPFFRSDLQIVLVDPLRPGDEIAYYPGMVNLLRADLIVVAKTDGAPPEALAEVARNVARYNPSAPFVQSRLAISVDTPETIRGRRVVVVEDGPTVTHGGMAFGAATVAARRFGAAEIIDPRPHALGTLAAAYRAYPHLDRVVPALGYSAQQVEDLRATLEATGCEMVVNASPAALARAVHLSMPVVQVRYRFEEVGGTPLRTALVELLERWRPGHGP